MVTMRMEMACQALHCPRQVISHHAGYGCTRCIVMKTPACGQWGRVGRRQEGTSKGKVEPRFSLEGHAIALHRHERYDGKGYSHGLANDQIGVAAQVASVCGVFDAITSARCYKDGMESVVGLRLIL